ncbi:MAG TPA: hypothetical protein VFA27_07530 [Vicinamibacterales bacterium]|nr:hypothetical protein [Vicinamibacterales bacterium]
MIALAALVAITIATSHDALTVPPQIPAGLTTIAFENTASEPHAIRIVEIRDKHTADDFGAFLKNGGAPPAWVRTVGGVAMLAPNLTEEYVTTLAAGTYAIVDGDRFAPMTVTAAPPAKPAPPAADIEVRLHDHGFQFSAPVEGPKPMWHLRNTGTEPHQAVLFRLTDGMTEFAARNWITNGGRGPAPGDPRGGVIEVPINGEAWFRVDLPPGRYVLLCGELEQEGRHFDLGMVYRFEIQ